MKTDGSILIDTKIIDGGMEKGFEMIKDEMSSVGITAKQVGKQIELSFSKMDVSKPIANAVAKVQQLEQQLANVTSDFKTAVSEGDDKSAERLAAKRVAVYERLEAAREKLSLELAQAVQKEADAEEKATQKKIKAAEKEAAAKKRAQEKQLSDMTKPVRRFGSRLREIISGALVFNLISSGLRAMTNYFGSALKSNKEFTSSFSQLQGALMTAFQPIYEFVAPALIYMIRLLTVAAQMVGRFFAALSGKSYGQMQKNAEALNEQASALGGVGGAAKEAAKQLAGFDEINRLESNEQGGGGGGGSGNIGPTFSELEDSGITENLNDILRIVGAVGAALLTWKIASAFTDSLSLAAGLALSVGGGILYATSWADAFANGIDWKNLSGMLIGMIALAGGLALAFGPVAAAVALLVTGVGMVVLAFKEWIETGELSNEACTALVIGITAIGGAISLLTGSWIPLLVAGIASAVVLIVKHWDTIKETFINVWNKIKETWSKVADWFNVNVIEPIVVFFSSLGDRVLEIWNSIVSWIVDAINSVVGFFNSVFGTNNTYQTTGTIPSASSYSAAPAAYSGYPDVPMLAKGAVIPPNKKFLAVLGDQSHGRNLEAPEDLIRQIVREESGGGNNDRLAQLLETLISVVEDIEVGDETIGKAAARYNRNTARARGY